MQTHESYVQAVARLAIEHASEETRAALPPFKLLYGVGRPGVRGVTIYGTWSNGHPEPECVVEIAAMSQESLVQVAGTVIHEIGHVLAGFAAGHGPEWHAACEALGLRRILAGGTRYTPAHFAPRLREAIAELEAPTDGSPRFVEALVAAIARVGAGGGFVATPAPRGWRPKPCRSSHGSRGGKSRGTGSGSRLLKAVCTGDHLAEDDEPCGWTFRISATQARRALDSDCPDKAHPGRITCQVCGSLVDVEGL